MTTFVLNIVLLFINISISNCTLKIICERASISSVFNGNLRYIFICIVFFNGTFMHASTNNLDSATNSTFHVGGSSLTNATDSSIAHNPQKKRKQIKMNEGTGERRQIE